MNGCQEKNTLYRLICFIPFTLYYILVYYIQITLYCMQTTLYRLVYTDKFTMHITYNICMSHSICLGYLYVCHRLQLLLAYPTYPTYPTYPAKAGSARLKVRQMSLNPDLANKCAMYCVAD